jgi:hypothetical protein
MTVSSDLAELQRMAAVSPPESDGSLSALETIPALFAYIATCARGSDRDEADDVEVLARLAQLTPDEVRECAGTLRALGYVVAADRLKQIAGRRRHDLRPLK